MRTICKIVLGASAMFLYILVSHKIFHRNAKLSNSRPHYRHDKKQDQKSRQEVSLTEDQCRQILPCLTNGSWSLRKDVSQEDVAKRVKTDEFISEYLGFPKISVRSDGRCGRQFPPTPGGKGASLCGAYSAKPCCNEDHAQCGSTAEYCRCNTCTDFRDYLPAELAQWNTKNNRFCKMKEFNHAEACRFLEENVTEMMVIGDSLMRHLFVALALLLTNNTAMGALNINIDPKRREQCQGELQFIDRGRYNCHGVIAHQWEELPPVCGGKTKFKISLEERYSLALFPNAKKAVTRLLNKTGSVVVFGVGLHMSLNTKDTIDKYVGPIVDMVTGSSNGWPKLIWNSLHGIDNYLRSDVNAMFSQWKRYNAEMKSYLKSKGVTILDSEQLTKGIKSFDARHFGLGGNMSKIQVLMNYLEKWFKMCQKYEIRN